MEKHQNPFDDFLKEALKGHQLVPREKARKAFLEEASTIMPARKGWNYWYYLPMLLVFIAGTLAFFYFRNGNEPAITGTEITENVNSNPTSSPNSSSTSTSTSTSDTTLTSTTTSSSTSTLISTSKSIPIIAKDDNINKISNPDATDDSTISHSSTKNTNTAKAENLTTETKVNVINVLPDTGSKEPSTDLNPASIINEMPSDTGRIPDLTPADLPDTSQHQRKGEEQPLYFTPGIYYLPEWMFNTLEGDKFVNNFGIDAIFYKGRVSIRTGAGISISKGITKNSIAYNDYLGSYNKLDSITFVYNESEHNFMPNLFMSTEKVWDSIQQFDSAEVVKRYTYLQVPLVLGFDFWQKGGLTVGVRIGTIMSLLLNSKQLSGPYNPGENQVVGVSMLTPDHVSINWQALGGINASARLTENIFLEIEPQAKYYYQSIYEKSDYTKKPWSVGVRVAVKYKF